MNCLKLGIPAIYLIPQMHHRDHGIDDNFVINCIVTFSSNFKRLQYRFLRYALFGVVVFYFVSARLLGFAWCFTTEKTSAENCESEGA